MASPASVSSLTTHALPRGYVMVKETELKEFKDDDPTFGGNYAPPSPHLERALLLPPRARTARMGGGKANKPIKAWLAFYTKNAGAANTAFAVNVDVRPNLDTSFGDWDGVFDEFRVLEAELIWNTNFTTPPSALANQTPNVAFAYEPAYDGTAPVSGVNQVLQFEKFSLLNAANVVGTGGTSAYLANPQAMSRGGSMRFKVKIPQTPLQSTTNTLLSTGMWRPTLDAGNYYWGSFVGYAAAGGTSAVLQVETFVRMLCEFRCRR